METKMSYAKNDVMSNCPHFAYTFAIRWHEAL
jgi:hypothetical protein